MTEIIRPYGDLCKQCPLSLESQQIASTIPPNDHPESEIIFIRQFCDWEYWRKRKAGVRVEGVIKDSRSHHTFKSRAVVGDAPERCPLPY